MKKLKVLKVLKVPIVENSPETGDVAEFEQNVSDAARLLKSLANDSRLLILCKLVEHSELHVGALVDAVGISQSGLSQHLAKLREEGLVTFRRDAQTLYYRCADPRAARLLAFLHELYCLPADKP